MYSARNFVFNKSKQRGKSSYKYCTQSLCKMCMLEVTPLYSCMLRVTDVSYVDKILALNPVTDYFQDC